MNKKAKSKFKLATGGTKSIYSTWEEAKRAFDKAVEKRLAERAAAARMVA